MRAPKGTKASAFLHESEVSCKMNDFPIHRWKTLVGGKSGPEDILFGTWELAPHAGHHSQKHDAPEIYYVISGKALWTVGDETQVVTKGMAIYTKSGAVHEMVNLTDEPVQAIWIWWAPEGDREVFNGEYVFTEEAHTQPENQRLFAAILVDPMAWHSIRKNVCSCAKC